MTTRRAVRRLVLGLPLALSVSIVLVVMSAAAATAPIALGFVAREIVAGILLFTASVYTGAAVRWHRRHHR